MERIPDTVKHSFQELRNDSRKNDLARKASYGLMFAGITLIAASILFENKNAQEGAIIAGGTLTSLGYWLSEKFKKQNEIKPIREALAIIEKLN